MKNNVHILNQEYFPALNAFKFVVTYDTNNVEGPLNLALLLVHRKNGSSILDFVNGIEYLLRAHSIDVILGDLNVNVFNAIYMQPLTDLMESFNYVQILKKPTFISGSLLDHVYVRQAIKANAHSSVISVYYSDHDAIRIKLLN